jgi:prepilin-type N-terminal cleavage/methylation domain-containing protein
MLHSRFSQRTSLTDGFTLVEIIVVVSVLGIMAGVITVGAVGARRTYAVRDASEQFADYLRESVSLTQNGVKVSGCTADGDSEAPQCSWYIVEAVSGSSTYDQKVVVDGSHSVSHALPAGTQFSNGAKATFAYCPPLLYVADDQIDFEDSDPSRDYRPAHDVCVNDLRNTTQERSFEIVHGVNPNIKACVKVGTPGIVTVTMDGC